MALAGFRIIDADGHVTEPASLYSTHIDPKFRGAADALLSRLGTGNLGIVPALYPPDGTLALIVAVFAWTPSTVNAALVALAAIITDAGVTVAVATALLASLMVTPPVGAGLASTTVPK